MKCRAQILAAAGAWLWVGVPLMACLGASRGEGLDVATLPMDMRADYEIFAQRCSKCHSLARPLQSGITDDGFWKNYFDRMRRQSGSGITSEDEGPILHFLHYYSMRQLQRRRSEADGPQ